MLKVTHCMSVDAADTAAADIVLSTADSAVASSSTAPADVRPDAAEKYAAEHSADTPAVAAVTCFDR